MRKVYLDLEVKVILRVNEGVDISDCMESLGEALGCVISPVDAPFDVEGISIDHYEITDSK